MMMSRINAGFIILLLVLLRTSLLFAEWIEGGLPICTQSENQSCAKIISDGSGGAIIVWGDERDTGWSSSDIYGQKIDENGDILWGLDGRLIYQGVGGVQIVSDDLGGAIINWTESDRGVVIQRIDQDGNTIWNSDGIAVSMLQSGGATSLISDGEGGCIVAWDNTHYESEDIYAQKVNSSGNIEWGWAQYGIVICNAVGRQVIPQIVPDGVGGAIIAWLDTRNGTYDIYAQRITSDGNVLWAESGVAVCTHTAGDIDMVSDNMEGAIIIYKNGTYGDWDIFAQRISSDGNMLWAENGVAICENIEDPAGGQIITDCSGGAIIVWANRRYYPQGGIFAQRINPMGEVQWAANGVIICSVPGIQGNPQAVSDGLGGAIITWDNFDDEMGNSNINGICVQRIDQNGNASWLPNGAVICAAHLGERKPQIAVDGNNTFIVWESGSVYALTMWDLYAQVINNGNIPSYYSPIVLVHGWNSDCSSFGNLENLLETYGFDVRCFTYPLNRSLYDVAMDFYFFLLNENIGNSGFTVIAHSLGGLMARQYILNHDYTTPHRIRKLITLGTPHNGVFASIFDEHDIQAIQAEYGSEFQWNLYNEWKSKLQTNEISTEMLCIVGAGPPEYYPHKHDGLIDIASASLLNLNYGAVYYVACSHAETLDWPPPYISKIYNDQHPCFYPILHSLYDVPYQHGSTGVDVTMLNQGEFVIGLVNADEDLIRINRMTKYINGWPFVLNHINEESGTFYGEREEGAYTFEIIPDDPNYHCVKIDVNIFARQTTVQSVNPPLADVSSSKVIVSGDIPPVEFENTQITMDFSFSPGGEVTVYYNNTYPPANEELSALPHYWNIASDIPASTFNVDILFKYNEAEVLGAGLIEENLEICIFDSVWQPLTTIVDKDNNILQININHFSIFCIADKYSPVATLLLDCKVFPQYNKSVIAWELAEFVSNDELQVSRANNGNNVFEDLEGKITQNGLSYEFVDLYCESGKSYRYRISVYNSDGRRILFETDIITIPSAELILHQNHPNPFNPSTTIEYYLPEKCNVVLDIYDVSGKRIACIVNESQEKGHFAIGWDGLDMNGNPVSSGTYFYRLKAGKKTMSKKMVLLK